MTTAQRITAKQWIRKFENLFFIEPIAVEIGEVSIYLEQVGQMLYPYYKILQDGNMLLGIGTQFIDDGAIMIGIGDWFVINSDGETKNESSFTDFEKFLCQQFIVIGGLFEQSDLVKF